MQTRQPIVTVLGHVDHGKTSLLDCIRKTNVVSREAGGITQSIGASVVDKITFIDTPGHAAFAKMRSQGANVCDLAILVVDVSGGVKPQTKEALAAIHQARIPFIVALTKIDLPAADIEGTKNQLKKEGVLFEGQGGNTPVVPVSAKTGQGIKNILEVISLLAQVSGLKGSPIDPLEAVVIETSKDKKGLLVSVVVKSGKILAGDNLFAGDKPVKIKGIFDWQGKPVKEVVAGEPALLMGFAELPEVGVVLSQQKREVGQKIVQKIQTENLKKTKLTLSLKAKTKGALEALKASLPKEVTVITAEVGEVYESDVLTAKASKARIFAFEAKVSPSVANLADAEGVVIEKFSVIYELLDRIEEILTQGEMKIKGKAEIIATFPFNSQKIAGCKVSQGIITKIDKLLLFRQEKEIGKVKAVSLQKQKQEIKEAKAGEEFGVLFEPQLDFKVGDVLVSLANGK